MIVPPPPSSTSSLFVCLQMMHMTRSSKFRREEGSWRHFVSTMRCILLARISTPDDLDEACMMVTAFTHYDKKLQLLHPTDDVTVCKCWRSQVWIIWSGFGTLSGGSPYQHNGAPSAKMMSTSTEGLMQEWPSTLDNVSHNCDDQYFLQVQRE